MGLGRGREEGRGDLQSTIKDSETDDGGAEKAVDFGHYCGFHVLLVYPVVDGSKGCLNEYEEEDGEADDLVFIFIMLRLLALSVEPPQKLAFSGVNDSLRGYTSHSNSPRFRLPR